MPPRAVLFDYGHTLVDFHRTEEALRHAYLRVHELVVEHARRSPEVTVPEAAELIDRIALAVDQLVAASYEERRLEELDILTLYRELLGGLGLQLPADLVRRVVALDHLAFRSCIVLPDDTRHVLTHLRESGLKVGFVSNAHLLADLLREDLEVMGLAELVDAGAFSCEVGVRKPDPRIFQMVLQELGVPAPRAVFVGDRVRDDVAGARAAGLHGAVLTHEWRQEEPDGSELAVIGRIADLPDVLSELGWL